MEMTDRRARLLEDVADSCRREVALEEAKKESAAEFNDQIKAIKTSREQLLKALDYGADPAELPFGNESKYPTQEEEIEDPEPVESDIFDDALELTRQAVDEQIARIRDDVAEESDGDIDAGRFFED